MKTKPRAEFAAWETVILATIYAEESAIKCLKNEIAAPRGLLRANKKALASARAVENARPK